MELNFKPDLNKEINSLSRSMKSSPQETVVMVLRNHFSLPVPEKWKVDSWIWYQIRLEFSQIHIQCTIKSERGGDGGHNLTNQSVEIRVGGSLDIHISSADVIDSFIINHKGTIGMFQSCMGGEDGIVWLNNGGGYLRGRVN